MSELTKVSPIFIDDGDPEDGGKYYDIEYYANEAGDFYTVDDVNEQVGKMLDELAEVFGASSMVSQLAFTAIVRNYFPEKAQKLGEKFAKLREQRMAEKALLFPSRYGVTGKLKP